MATKTAPKFLPAPSRPDTTIPDLGKAFNTIAAHTLADVIDSYLQAKHRDAVIASRVDASTDCDEWWCYATALRDLLANHVARGVIYWHHSRWQEVCERAKSNSDRLLYMRWNNCGVIYRGRVYSAVCDPDFDHHKVGETEGNFQIMQFAEMELPEYQGTGGLEALVDLDEFFGRKDPSAFPVTKSQAERDASFQELMAKDGLGEAMDAKDAAERRARERNGPAYAITTQDILLCHESNRLTIDEVIAEQVEVIEKHQDDDVAIWQGERILAAICVGPDGKPIVTRFDESPAPSLETASVFGDLPTAPDDFDVRLNAPPTPKRRDKGESKPKAKRAPRK